jgi:type IV pilus assembly protein PilA
MKKQSGFTLIELMVVMAIIAILATAGLSAYSGYIKKTRDTKRIADVSAISTIVLAKMSTTGLPPATAGEVTTAIADANNNQAISDPLNGKTSCLNATSGSTASSTCAYKYTLCDAGTGFAVATMFESTANQTRMQDDSIGDVAADAQTNTVASNDDNYFSVGSCRAYCDTTTSCGSGATYSYTNI